MDLDDLGIDLSEPAPILLAGVGAFFAWFTSIGGIGMFLGQPTYNPGLVSLILAPVAGAIVGYIWGKQMS